MIDREATVDPVVPPPLPVTAMVAALLVMVPPNPCIVAVIVVVPAPTPVTTPEELTVATDVVLEAHATVEVMFSVLAGWLPWLIDPIAVSCVVLLVPIDTVEGETVMESISVAEPQPKNGRTRLTSSNALAQ